MNDTAESSKAEYLGLADELILMLIDEFVRKLRLNPIPSLKPSNKLNLRISEQRRGLPT